MGSKGLDTLLVAMAATKTAAHKNFWIALCIQTCFEIRLEINSFSSIKEPITGLFKFFKMKKKLQKKKNVFNIRFVLKLNHMQSVKIFFS